MERPRSRGNAATRANESDAKTDHKPAKKKVRDGAARAPSVGNGTVEHGAKLAIVIAQRIVDELVAKNALPGDRLPSEAAMLVDYQVARGTLRETLRLLEVHGIIRIKPGPGGGPVVAEPNSSDFARTSSLHYQIARASIRELFQARLVIEPAMARLVAERREPLMIAEIKSALEFGHEVAQAGKQHEVGSGAAAARFHDALLHTSGNKILDLVGGSLLKIVLYASPDFRLNLHNEEAFRYHDAIFDHLARGNATSAERLMREHIQQMIESYEASDPEFLEFPVRWTSEVTSGRSD
ncbi:MAG: GntR family transcriptional regulator, transcriptional repressor for pyruvate dehydrogenase complex [Acidimicrobiaceae bacterium]|jgi:DNA-binding FadR family transcriptional regulator